MNSDHESRSILRVGLFALFLLLSGARAIASEGYLVLVGGGPTPADIFQRALAISGGRHAIVAVLPQTYPDDTIADAAVTLWNGMRAAEVIKVSRTDATAARLALERASLIWMPGGFPSYFMQAIADTDIAAIIRARFAAGVTIGGASAGAMAMSATMLADEVTPAGVATHRGPTEPGLGLWPDAIVSPHFTERRRLAPLLPIVQNHPELIGIGLDEGTGVFVSRGTFEVLGRGSVSVLEGGRSDVRRLRAGARYRYRR